MAKHTYRVVSPEGETFANAAEGSELELDLDVKTKRAVIAAGWLEQTDADDDDGDTTKAKGGKG